MFSVPPTSTVSQPQNIPYSFRRETFNSFIEPLISFENNAQHKPWKDKKHSGKKKEIASKCFNLLSAVAGGADQIGELLVDILGGVTNVVKAIPCIESVNTLFICVVLVCAWGSKSCAPPYV